MLLKLSTNKEQEKLFVLTGQPQNMFYKLETTWT